MRNHTSRGRKGILGFVALVLTLGVVSSCATGARRLDDGKDMVSDTGGLTRQEMERAADLLAAGVAKHFQGNRDEDGVFVAHYPTKNETSEQIPTRFFDTAFVSALLREKIYTVRVESRTKSLKEIAFSRSGLTDSQLSIGSLKSPNYFVRCRIEENMFRSDGDKIVEQTINIELVKVETTVVVWSERKVYRKAAARGRKEFSF